MIFIPHEMYVYIQFKHIYGLLLLGHRQFFLKAGRSGYNFGYWFFFKFYKRIWFCLLYHISILLKLY